MIYLLRHGQTDWNARHKLQGRTDIPLNQAGRQMAQKAHDDYLNVHFDICYTSPLLRARETAELLLEGRDVPIYTDDRLMEMSFGEYEGIENSFSIPDCPINVIFQKPELYKDSVGGAETFAELFKRTGELLAERVMPLAAHNKDVLIVGHGAMNGSILCQLRHKPIGKFWDEEMGNCELIAIELE